MKKFLIQFITIISIVLLLCVNFSCQKQVPEEIPEAMTVEEAQARVERVLQIYNTGNLDSIEEFFAPEFVSHDYAANQEQVGLDALKKQIADLRTQFPDLIMTLDEIILMGDKTVTRWTATGTNTGPLQTPAGELLPTGKEAIIGGVTVSRRVNEKTVEQWVYYNMWDLLQQIGFTLTPPQPPEPPEEIK